MANFLLLLLTYGMSNCVIEDSLGSSFSILREAWIIQKVRAQKKSHNLQKITHTVHPM